MDNIPNVEKDANGNPVPKPSQEGQTSGSAK
jgi:hypothetical protein